MNSDPGSIRSCDVAGPAGAPAILFLHGIRSDRNQWALQAQSLSGEYRVISMDLPGFGVSVGVPFTLERAVAEIERVIDEAAGGRALLVGLSLGGYSAMEFASRHPEKVSGLTLASCSVNPHLLLALSYRLTAFARRLAARSPAARSTGHLLGRALPRRLSAIIARCWVRMRGRPTGTAELLDIDFTAKIRSYTGPVLFVNGEDDLPFRAGEEEFMAAVRKGKLVVIPGAGHTANLDRPEAFNDALREFVSSVQG
jgi:pimeloyl-ACP methyl ester carboxylesterase